MNDIHRITITHLDYISCCLSVQLRLILHVDNIGRTPDLLLPFSSSSYPSSFYSTTASTSSSSFCSSIVSNPLRWLLHPPPLHKILTQQQTSNPTNNSSDVDSIYTCSHCDRTSTPGHQPSRPPANPSHKERQTRA
nr:unnamed protein product [Spirometra erinaceieuropaei]